jgi:hypothetical protein
VAQQIAQLQQAANMRSVRPAAKSFLAYLYEILKGFAFGGPDNATSYDVVSFPLFRPRILG